MDITFRFSLLPPPLDPQMRVGSDQKLFINNSSIEETVRHQPQSEERETLQTALGLGQLGKTHGGVLSHIMCACYDQIPPI